MLQSSSKLVLSSILLFATTSCDSKNDDSLNKRPFVSFTPTAERDVQVTVSNNNRSQLLEIAPASPPRERLVTSFDGRYETILGPLKTNGCYLAATIKDSYGSSRLMLISKDGQLRRVINEVGASLGNITYLPESSQLLQLQEPEDPRRYERRRLYYVNLYNIIEKKDDIEVQRVAQVEFPRIPTRAFPKFKLCKGRPIFGAIEHGIFPFVGEVVNDELRVLSPEYVAPRGVYVRGESELFASDYDFWPDKEWVIYAGANQAALNIEVTSRDVRIQLRNWTTNEVVGSTYTTTLGPTCDTPVAFINESRIAIATGKEFIILTRKSIDDSWEREKSIPIAFNFYPYATDIQILDEHSAVVISSSVARLPSKYQIVEF